MEVYIMKTCPVCGSKMSDTNTYCGICGAAVKDAEASVQTSAAPINTASKPATAVAEKSPLDAIDNLENEIKNESTVQSTPPEEKSYADQTIEYTEEPEAQVEPQQPKLREITPEEIKRAEKEVEDFESDYSPADMQIANNSDGKSGAEKFKDGCTNVVYKIKDFFTKTNDETASMDPDDIEKHKTMSLMSYLGLLLYYIPMMLKPRSKYLRFHGNQGLTLTIASLGLAIINGILCLIFGAVFADTLLGLRITNGFGLFLIGLFSTICYGAILIWAVVGIYNAVTGKAKELPLIGKFRILK